ncbi:MAG: flagellar basal-body MS-ring/collar protein FliF [Bacillota bacterium]|jgi:flagellar M-ring protein FliF
MNPNELLVSARQKWQATKPGRRVALIAAGALVLAVLVFLGQLILRPAYAPLLSNLDPVVAGDIVEELNTMKVPYRLADDGRTIEVPKDQVYDVKIRLASAGVLHERSEGFSLFDAQKFGVTDFEQQVAYQRALQEELRRTIVSLDAVEQARVHLVLPRRSLFLDDQISPSASVALKIKAGHELDQPQVRGICDLLLGSIEGLQLENIHIIDTLGNVLSDDLRTESEGARLAKLTMDQYQVRREFEKELEKRIQQMLNRVLGPNKAVAMVTADLDFRQQQTTSTTYGPGQILSEQRVTESGTGAGGAAGQPGTDTEMPGLTLPGLNPGGGSSYEREEAITNYQVDVVQETLLNSPGNLLRLSTSVILNGDLQPGQLEDVRGLVATAIGYNEERGDQLTVSSLPFDESYFDLPAEEPATGEGREQLLVYAAAGAAVLLIVAIALIIIFRRRSKAREQTQQEEIVQPVKPAEELKTSLAEPVTEAPGYQRDLKNLARDNPEEVAEVLKVWLRE